MTKLIGERREYVLGSHVRATILTTGAETDGRHDVVESRLPPGEPTPLHLHTRYEERIYVIEGELAVWAGDEHTTVGPGGFYTIPINVPHMVRSGPEGALALAISSPAGFAELIARTATPAHLVRPGLEIDLELFARVNAELGDIVLGPPGALPGTQQ
jgi:quercetin dioxygenase-like cupin family protein